MLIRLGYDIALRLPFPTAVIYVLHVHPARKGDLVGSEDFRIEPELSVEEYSDGFGNHCGRVNSQQASFAFSTTQSFAILAHSIPTHPTRLNATFANCRWKPYLLSCRAVTVKVDSELLDFAGKPSAPLPLKWARVQAICDFVHGHLRFD
jgi:hypothetical protein